jgi:adenosyl cobinamide kinase/adenosyl cobinamide phosphate guanylyltransferase
MDTTQGSPPQIMENTSESAATQDLENCDWEQLQEKFTQTMEEHFDVEQALQRQATQLIEVILECITLNVTARLTMRPRYLSRGRKLPRPVMKIELLRGCVLP